MWLKRIELKNFKSLVDFQAQFSPGINVVKGPLNEMGKSTLLEGIIIALFENPRSTAKSLKDYVSWGSTRQCRTSLEFENKENRYLLEKDFGKGTIRLIDYNNLEELDTFKEISGKVAELLGTNSDGLFTCTSCIRQAQVSEISSGKKEISESLEEVITGGEESTLASQVIRKLEDKISEIRKGLDRPAKFPGTIKSLKNDTERVSQRLKEVREEVSKVETRRTELAEIDKELVRVQQEYARSKALLDKNKQRRETEASIEDFTQKYDEVEKLLGEINKLMSKLEGANEALRSIEGLENEQQVSEFRKGMDAIQNRRGDIEKDLAMREDEVTEAKAKLDKRKFPGLLSSAKSTAVAAIISIGGIVGILVGPVHLLSLIILGMALLGASIWARSVLTRDRIRVSDLEERIQKMKEALGELGREEKELLAEVNCNTVGEFDEKGRSFNSWLEEKRSFEAQLKGMLRGKMAEDFQKQKREIARGLAVEQAKLSEELKATALSPDEYIKLESKVEGLGKRQTELEGRKRHCQVIIEQARFNIEDQIKLEEELESLEEALKQEEKKVKVYGSAREFISRARTETLSSANEALEKEIQRYFAVFTNGKYKQVRISKEELKFWVYSDEKGDWAKPEDLSGGVIDEFYLAFRLALAELIFGDKKPPLILDDPFVNFDSVRLANTLNFLKTLASDYQIIIFTLGDLYDKVADNIIPLPLGKK